MSDLTKLNRRFAVEHLDNGVLVKISEAGNDKLVGRFAFPDATTMLAWLKVELGVK